MEGSRKYNKDMKAYLLEIGILPPPDTRTKRGKKPKSSCTDQPGYRKRLKIKIQKQMLLRSNCLKFFCFYSLSILCFKGNLWHLCPPSSINLRVKVVKSILHFLVPFIFYYNY